MNRFILIGRRQSWGFIESFHTFEQFPNTLHPLKSLFLLLPFLFSPNAGKAQNFQCFSNNINAPTNGAGCASLSSYIPTSSDHVKTVKVAFHIMQREAPNSPGNFDETSQADLDYLNALFNRLNDLYTECNYQWCDCDYKLNLDQVRDSRIRFELVGMYFHPDNVGYINQDATYSNLYCYNNYAICKDEIVNIFFCQNQDVTSGYAQAPI